MTDAFARVLPESIELDHDIRVLETALANLTVAKLQFPDEWARSNVVYGRETGWPGPRNPGLTPYMRDFVRSFGNPKWKRIVGVTSAQSGKTASLLDIIGERLDNRPVPILYVGPGKDFLTNQFEPRLVEMFSQSESLSRKVLGGLDSKSQKKTLKRVSGVRLRLAHAGSSAALKSDAAALALVDEYDEMMKNVRGQGDPLGLVEARGDTYADFQCGITSTPTLGLCEIVHDEESGLDFWGVGEEEDVSSPIWRLWQEGTRHHFAWPCPHCSEYFIPRSKLLRYPQNATPAQAGRNSWLECPHCSGEVRDEHKADCNERGRFVAPGESIDKHGNITGEPHDTSTLSFWVSGFCSPFQTIGDRAEKYLRAVATGEADKIQTAVNAGFGELYMAGGGELLEPHQVAKLREPYSKRIPDGVRFIVAAVDVQSNRLPYVIRGFGAGGTSWLLEHGYIWGLTKDIEVWEKLSEKLTTPIEGRLIKLAFVDSGFRPGKKDQVPSHRVYQFCHKHRRFVFPTKGASKAMARPVIESAIEVNIADGKAKKHGLRMQRLDTDHWKSVVHERLSFDREAPGALHFSEAADEDYCQQIVAEARVRGPSGKWIWVARYKENHFLDCESMAAAAAWVIDGDRSRAFSKEDHQKRVNRSLTLVSNSEEKEQGQESAPAPAPAPEPRRVVKQQSIRNRFSDMARRFNQ